MGEFEDRYPKVFLDALKKTLSIEGGPTNYDWDPGGNTVYGISKNNWPQYWESGPPTFDRAVSFYWVKFWGPLRLNEIKDERLKFEIFDSAVNCGKRNAVMFAQNAYNLLRLKKWGVLQVDGVIGPHTVGALNMMSHKYDDALLAACNYYQADYYATRASGLRRKAIRGWFGKRLSW